MFRWIALCFLLAAASFFATTMIWDATHPNEWVDARVDCWASTDDDSVIVVQVTGPGQRVRAPVTRQDADSVQVTGQVERPRGGPDDVSVTALVDVPLDQPLAGRRVLAADGSPIQQGAVSGEVCQVR